jgi:hypothetical protein
MSKVRVYELYTKYKKPLITDCKSCIKPRKSLAGHLKSAIWHSSDFLMLQFPSAKQLKIRYSFHSKFLFSPGEGFAY